jgi:hypothetical protein
MMMARTSSAQTSLYTLPPGNLVQNGGFEQGLVDWGWTYNFGVWEGFPDAAEGGNYGQVYGTIYQTLPTVPGQEYQLEFATSGNFNVSSVQVLNALWNGLQVASVSWNPSGHNVNNLGWVWTTVDVTASSSSTLLTFSNPYVGDGSQRIPNIDAISVVAVPEPSSTVLFGLGGIALLLRRRPAGKI